MTQLQTLIEEIPKYQPAANLDLLQRAYRFSERSHHGSAAGLRRALPLPPPRGRRPPRQLQDGRDHGHGRPPPRRPRGHQGHQGRPPARVRRRDRRAGGRGDQDRQAGLLLPRGAPGRELPQDAGGDGARPPRADDQARRPPPQHADPRLPAHGEGPEDRPGDPRHLRPARPPPRHGQGQGGARGPGPPGPASGRLPGADAARRQAAARARGRDQPADHAAPREAGRGGDRVQDRGPAQALLLDLEEDARGRARVRRDLRPHRGPRADQYRPRLLRGPRGRALAVEAGARPLQGLHRDAQGQHVPVAAHDGDRAQGRPGRDPDPHRGDAPDRRGRHRGPLALQGEAERPRQVRRRLHLAAPAPGVAERDERPQGVPRQRPPRPVPRRGLRVHPARGREGPPGRGHPGGLRLHRAHRRRASLRRAPRSTASWSRCATRSTRATSSRS